MTAFSTGLEVAGQVSGFLGVGLLAVPATYVARYASLAANLVRTRKQRHPGWEASATMVVATLREKQNAWNWWMSAALLGGTACAGFSYLLGFLAILARS